MTCRSVLLHVLLADEVADSSDIGGKPVAQHPGIAHVQIEGQPAKPTASRPQPDPAIPQDLELHGGQILHRDGSFRG